MHPTKIDRGDGVQLAYALTTGRSPTLVFLPGFMSDMTGDKATMLAALAAKALVLSFVNDRLSTLGLEGAQPREVVGSTLNNPNASGNILDNVILDRESESTNSAKDGEGSEES